MKIDNELHAYFHFANGSNKNYSRSCTSRREYDNFHCARVFQDNKIFIAIFTINTFFINIVLFRSLLESLADKYGARRLRNVVDDSNKYPVADRHHRIAMHERSYVSPYGIDFTRLFVNPRVA